MSSNLRIISGKYKGKTFDGDSIIGTRPTMNRVKESLFGMIQNNIKGSVCLDLFAGSGNLGLEAISNGSLECYFVDHNKIAVNTILNNIKKIGINEKAYVLNSDYNKALNEFKDKNIKFDIIFLDPPYKEGLINDCLNKIIEFNLLKENGIIVCEYEEEIVKNDNLTIWKERSYGSKKIVVYRK